MPRPQLSRRRWRMTASARRCTSGIAWCRRQPPRYCFSTASAGPSVPGAIVRARPLRDRNARRAIARVAEPLATPLPRLRQRRSASRTSAWATLASSRRRSVPCCNRPPAAVRSAPTGRALRDECSRPQHAGPDECKGDGPLVSHRRRSRSGLPRTRSAAVAGATMAFGSRGCRSRYRRDGGENRAIWRGESRSGVGLASGRRK